MVHRSFFNQLADYRFVAEVMKRKPPAGNSIKSASEIATRISRYLLSRSNEMSYFKLHKLFYLAECESVRATGERLTPCYIVRQKDGPYVVDLNIKRLRKAMSDLRIFSKKGTLYLRLQAPDLFVSDDYDLENESIISTVLEKYGSMNDRRIKTVVYMTGPMRSMLRREKDRHENLFNSPVDFSILKVNNLADGR
jgi:uncharacterized phage-associated protein